MPKTADAVKAPAKSAPKAAAKASGKASPKEPAGGAAVAKAASKTPAPKPTPAAKAPAAAKPASPKPAPAAKAPATKPTAAPPKAAAPKDREAAPKASPAKPESSKPSVTKTAATKPTEAAKSAATKTVVLKPTHRADSKADKDKDKGEIKPLERVVERITNGVRSLVWGPVDTRRLGRIIVVDMSAPQVAMTARRGLSIPRASLIVTTAAREIITLAREGVKIDTIAVVGSDMDPSGHPDLREITENLRALRDKHLQRAKLRVFTCARDLGRYDLRSTLAMYDRVHLQLEWGTAKVFSAVTGEKPTQLTSLLKHAGGLDHLVVEASFFKGSEDHDNSNDAEVKLWIKKVQELKPQEVHVLPGLGSASQLAKVKPVPKARRDEIVEELTEKSGINVVSVQEDDLQLV